MTTKIWVICPKCDCDFISSNSETEHICPECGMDVEGIETCQRCGSILELDGECPECRIDASEEIYYDMLERDE